jgi:hypothetical protein
MNKKAIRPLPLWTMQVDLDLDRPGAITLLPHGLAEGGKVIPLMPLPLSLTQEQVQSLIEVMQEAARDALAMTESGHPGRH